MCHSFVLKIKKGNLTENSKDVSVF